MSKIIDMIGFENEYLKVLDRAPDKIYKDGSKAIQWNCLCKFCNKTIFPVTSRNIREEKVKSCGCKTFELKSKSKSKHRMFGTRLYGIWAHMISRCYNEKVPEYVNYGGRGIIVCDLWKNSFEEFQLWANQNGYNENLTIDRINVNGNYEPSNCRWATNLEQVRNRRNTVMCEIDGISKPLAEWCEIYNKDYKLVHKRIFVRKWDVKRALTEEKYGGSKQNGDKGK